MPKVGDQMLAAEQSEEQILVGVAEQVEALVFGRCSPYASMSKFKILLAKHGALGVTAAPQNAAARFTLAARG